MRARQKNITPETMKVFTKQSKWKAKILMAGWKTLKDFCLDNNLEWHCFREYLYSGAVCPEEKRLLIESAIKVGKKG